jgi:mRNA interferase RelE/StbE
MSFTVIYHPDVSKVDLPKIPNDIRLRIKKAIEERLMTDPTKYGKPLRKSLKGYWKLRVGDYRIVYKIEGNEVIVLGIIHRKEVYKNIHWRL